MPTLPEFLADHLRGRRRLEIDSTGAIVCAVLIPLMPVPNGTAAGRDEDYDVVYTLRSEHLPSHKGQVAFPGGKRHGIEESIETALRESEEEVGIVPADVRIVGALDDVSTMAGQYVITPWVGVLPAAYTFQPDPQEVADIFHVRLSALGAPEHQSSTKKSWGGNAYDVPIITAGRHEIWGATHEITRNFLAAIREARGRKG